MKEAVFNILGPPTASCRVLDLFAGSGSLGLEALSRGAQRVTFVDRSRSARAVLEGNISSLGVAHQCEVLPGEVLTSLPRFAERRSGAPFDWIFADPPYAGDLAEQALVTLASYPLLTADGVVVVEHSKRTSLGETYGELVRTDHRSWGDTDVSMYRLGVS